MAHLSRPWLRSPPRPDNERSGSRLSAPPRCSETLLEHVQSEDAVGDLTQKTHSTTYDFVAIKVTEGNCYVNTAHRRRSRSPGTSAGDPVDLTAADIELRAVIQR
jgi:hypothetical protein